MTRQFSTMDVREKDRPDYWHELVSHTYASCRGIPVHKKDFNAKLTTHAFGPMEISEVTSSGISYARSSEDIRRAPRDELFLSLMQHGSGHLCQNGRNGRQNCGDILIYESGRPYDYSYDQSYCATLIRIPRPLAAARLPYIDQLGGLILTGSSPVGRLLASLVSEAAALSASANAEQTTDLSPAMLDMMAATIRNATEEPGNRTDQAKLRQIQRYMRQNLADDTLTLRSIAKAQGVSLRTLCRIFAGTGTSPMAWLMSQRLQSAYNALAEHRVTSVTAAAEASGFRTLSHFGRSFRNTYGISPGTLLSGRN